MIELANRNLNLVIDPQNGFYSLDNPEEPAVFIHQARLGIEVLARGRPARLPAAWPEVDIRPPSGVDTRHGHGQAVSLVYRPWANGLAARVDFTLLDGSPLCLLRVTLENTGPSPLEIHRILLLEAAAGATGCGAAGTPDKLQDLGFFANGWQSWSPTAAYPASQAQRHTRLKGIVTPMLANAGTPQPSRAGHYAADFFGVVGNRRTRNGWCAGFLAQKQHFGTLEARVERSASGEEGFTVRLWANGDDALLDPGQAIATDWAALAPVHLDDPDPLESYLNAAARENDVAALAGLPSLAGWSSWYQYFEKVSQDAIRSNLARAADLRDTLPLQLFQIDDGFETHPGDWFSFKPTFPDGLAPLAREISAAGMIPGLWLAPFIVHPRARLIARHPDFLLYDAAHRPVNAGFGWNTFTRALDLTHPGALDYTRQVVQTAVQEWGYRFLKLDFLYAGALAGRRYDPHLTRAQALRRGMETLRAAAGPQTILLGCGVPLGSALGLVQAMRIGEDVNVDWAPTYFGASFPFQAEWAMPAARNALLNTLTRSALHGRWWANDPDCLLVRKDTHLTLDEVHTLATAIALTGGLMLLSDDLARLDAERLELASAMTPVIGQRARLLDWFDSPNPSHLRLDLSGPVGAWSLLGLFNWSDSPQPLALDLRAFDLPAEGSYWVASVWDQRVYALEDGKLVLGDGVVGAVPPHGVGYFAVYRRTHQAPQFLGSSLTLSQGLEVSKWQVLSHGVHLAISLPRHAKGAIVLALPRPIARAWLNGQPLIWKGHAAGVYSFDIEFDRQAEIKIETVA